MNKKDVLKKTTAFLAALSFLMTNQNQCIYLMAEEITTPNTNVENSAPETTTSVSEKNNVSAVVTTQKTEPVITTVPETTENTTTTASSETTTVTMTTPMYVYNFTFYGESFNNDKIIIKFLKAIGIREQYIEITENGVQVKLPYTLKSLNQNIISIDSVHAKAEAKGHNITFTEHTLFKFNFVGESIPNNYNLKKNLISLIGVNYDQMQNFGHEQCELYLPYDFAGRYSEDTLLNIGDISAKVTLEENVFSFTEYYDISPVIDYVNVPESIIDNHVPHNAKLSLKEYYRFEDKNITEIPVTSNLDYKNYGGMYIISKDRYYKISEKTYSIKVENENCKVDNLNTTYSWKKDKEYEGDKFIISGEGEYIKSITIYDDNDKAVYSNDLSNQMLESCEVVFSVQNEGINIAHNKVFTVKVDTVPKTVSVPLYFFNPETNEWEHNAETDYRTFEVSNKGTITVPQRIQDENNVDKHLFITITENSLPQDAPILGDIIKNISSHNPNFKYSPSIVLCYYNLKQNIDFDFENNIDSSETLKYTDNIFIRKLSTYFLIMKLSCISSMEYITMDELVIKDSENVGLSATSNELEKNFEKKLNLITPPTFLNITGILDNSGNNYLDSNKYIYLDAHAPRFDLSTAKTHPTGTNTKGEVWTNSNFKFDITVDDRFSVSANDFGEELHNQLDGITSKTGKVIITDEAGNTHTFAKNSDGTFGHTVTAPATAEGTVPEEAPALNYSIEYESITDNADNTETLRFYVSTDEILFVQNFTVSVEDGVGNPSASAESKTITARIEKTAPVVTSAEIRGFVENSNTIVSRKDGKKGNVVLSGEFSDGDSGIKEIRAVPVSDKSTTTVTPETIGKSDKFSFTFSNDSAEGDKAKLKITVTDFAGNTSEVIYSGDAE
ncbi:MAG: hypothetical protein J6A58_13050, partial [Oscillospiraceae bacterium]|nr:hypothetical protein [Oscillospiraceae bacterium]